MLYLAGPCTGMNGGKAVGRLPDRHEGQATSRQPVHVKYQKEEKMASNQPNSTGTTSTDGHGLAGIV